MGHIDMKDAMMRTGLEAQRGMTRGVPGRVVPIASGADIASRMLHSERMYRPASMHRVVAEAMTIKETSFFRDLLPFQILRESIVPRLMEKRRDVKRLRLWSAGCATGQEAYSLAMMLSDRFPELEDWDVQIVGTDISGPACTYARRGVYSRLEMNRGLPVRLMLRYFVRCGDEWSVSEPLRKMTTFTQGDLNEPGMMEAEFDVVLLRNVLLYLAPGERARALAEVYARMHPDASLLLGTSEQAEDATDLFQMELNEEQMFYRAVVAA